MPGKGDDMYNNSINDEEYDLKMVSILSKMNEDAGAQLMGLNIKIFKKSLSSKKSLIQEKETRTPNWL